MKIRFVVRVESDGGWSVSGADGWTDDETVESLPTQVHWLDEDPADRPTSRLVWMEVDVPEDGPAA